MAESRERENLSSSEVGRYGRQMIMKEIGKPGQLKLANASIAIVGCGGLGCPAALYLAAAGVGRLGLIDGDEVEVSNLHRQVIHTESRVGVPKAESATSFIDGLNSLVKCETHVVHLTSSNAIDILSEYDLILDCTDNVPTRYLLNDAAVICNKPLVSGSALRWEGQLTVYHYKGGPCYRCLFPSPPPPETVTNCSDGGVLGVVPGILGCLQALEAIKIIVEAGEVAAQRMVLVDALDLTFRKIKLRGRRQDCAICGDSPTITALIDYQVFCSAKASDGSDSLQILDRSERISAEDLQASLADNKAILLVDVRPEVEFGICKIDNSINVPLRTIKTENDIDNLVGKIKGMGLDPATTEIITVCRRGNDSQIAVNKLKELCCGNGNGGQPQQQQGQQPHQQEQHQQQRRFAQIRDLEGGLNSWSTVVPDFPLY